MLDTRIEVWAAPRHRLVLAYELTGDAPRHAIVSVVCTISFVDLLGPSAGYAQHQDRSMSCPSLQTALAVTSNEG